MGLLSRFRKNEMDEPSYDEVRSHVLGQEYPQPPPELQPPSQLSPPPANRFANRFGDIPDRYSERMPMETPGFGAPEFSREPIALEQKEDRTNFEILDRLAMIEAQLAAIRSQTETINERLKNIAAQLPRRY